MTSSAYQPLIATDLTCEHLVDPIGIDTPRPRLSWQVRCDRRGARQTAYRLLVAGSPERLAADHGDLWDSGQVESDQSVHVAYGGTALASRQQCWWKVQIRDETGLLSPWSEPARFEMGLLKESDWQAAWIGDGGPVHPSARPAPHLRKDFVLPKPVKAARAYVCGLGYFELHVNGRRIGDNVLDPGFTRYDKRVLYVTHDLTGAIRTGPNALGVILGNGFYNQAVRDAWHFEKTPWRDHPKLLLQVHVEYDDGTGETIVSDGSWRVATGPIDYDQTRNGEHYDATKELGDWSLPGYDDSAWQPAATVAPPAGRLKAQMLPPIRVTQTLTPKVVREVDRGVFVFDMGQNFAGWAQLRVSGPAGAEIRLRYAERVDQEGRLDNAGIAGLVKEGEFQTDKYVLRGRGEEVWEPRFCYHGFQYVEVTGWPGTPTLDNLRGRVVHTAFESAGRFECSNDLLNRIQACTRWSYVSNFHSIPTDCPHREKNGWTGDAHLAAEAGLYNFRAAAAYAKWMDDFADEQREAGDLPGIVPTSGWGYEWGNGPCWDSAYLIIPWLLYLYRGDVSILAAHYDGMKRYVDYLTAKAWRGLIPFGLGDWVPPFGQSADYTCPLALSSSGYCYYDATILSQAAALLGKADDAAEYAELAERTRRRINEVFYDPASGLYAGGSQTAQGTALFQGIADPRQRGKVLRQLVADIRRQKGRINVGIHGAKFVLNVLSDLGRHDVAYSLATQREFPSWGWWIDQGATTLWEDWRGHSSRNHIMFGDISAWAFKNLAGINVDPRQPGFKNVLFRPRFEGDLEWVRAEHESPYGTIRSAWRRDGGSIELELTVPANSTATLVLPTGEPAAVTESGRPAEQADGVALGKCTKKQIVFELASGKYRFGFPL